MTAVAGFSGAAVRVARVFNGMTQAELAERVSVSPGLIPRIEAGREPSETVLAAIALVLGFDVEFFRTPLPGEFTEQECFFRTRASTAMRVRRQVLARGTLFAIVARYLSQSLILPTYNVPERTCAVDDEIEDAADACRDAWGLGRDTPILNMARVLEHAGVLVTRLENAEESRKLDAFSRRGKEGEPSIVVLNTAKGSTSRTRFDMAHELGHLVLHHKVNLSLKMREAQADRFAGAFLLPRRGFGRDFWAGGTVDWTRLPDLKRRWKASYAAMIVRAYQLELIDAVEYRRAYKKLSRSGWVHGEPHEPEADRPELFRKAVRTLWEKKGMSVPQIAQDLRWTVPTFEAVTGLASTEPADGDGVLTLVGSPAVRRSSSKGEARA